jgi:hypothetical protein
MKVRIFVCLTLFAFAFAPSSLLAQATCPQPCPSPSASPSSSPTFFSTEFEISPYGGFLWPASNNAVGSFKNNQIFGVRGGGFVTQGFEIGANWYWNNHFQPKSDNTAASFAGDLGFPQAHVTTNVWEVEFTYNFGRRALLGSTAVRPYLVAGGGGVTTNLKDGDLFVLNNRFIDVPGVSPDTLQAALQNGTLQSIVPVNTSDGVAFVGTPTGSTVVLANDVLRDNSTYFQFSYGGGLKTQRVWGILGFFGDVRGRTIPNFFNGHGTNMFELSAGLNFSWGER